MKKKFQSETKFFSDLIHLSNRKDSNSLMQSKKLPIKIGATLFVILSFAFLITYNYQSAKLEKSAILDMQNQAKTISLLSQNALAQFEEDKKINLINLQNISESMANLEDVMWLEIFDSNANVIAHSHEDRVGQKPLEMHSGYVKKIMRTGERIEDVNLKQGRFNYFIPYFGEDSRNGKKIKGVLELVLKINHNEKIIYKRQHALTLSQMAESIVERSENQKIKNLEHLQQLAELIGKIEGVKNIAIYDNTATLVAHANIGQRSLEKNAAVKKILISGETISQMNSFKGLYNYLIPYYSFEQIYGSKKIAGVIEVVMDLNSVNKNISTTKKDIWIVFILLNTVIAILLYVILTKVISKYVLEIKFLQANMANASKLASLGEFAGGIAHEINNPLAIIQGKSSHLLALIRTKTLTPENGKKELETIIATSKRVAKIIKSLKEFSRNAEQDPFEQIELKTLIDDVLSLCSAKFEAQKIRLEVDIVPELMIDCRVAQFEQVILNLLNNAYDAVIPLSEKWIHIDTAVFGEQLRISVTDSGNGISADITKKLMQPFFTTKEVGKGAGLGLSTSKGIIEEHGGQLRYDNNFPHTRFIIEFPYKRAES